jgi:hypothetical protein
MRWFRLHRPKVAALALGALLFQLVLAFGHFHLDHMAGSNIAVAAVAGKTLAAPAGKTTTADLPASPRHKAPPRFGDDFCAICASMVLIVVPHSPALAPATAFFETLQWSFVATRAASTERHYFNARGPPSLA